MKIKQLALEEIKRLWRHSQALTPYLEELHPKLHRKLISYVSEISEPFETGMGLQVERLDDEQVEVQLPVRRRTQGSGERAHTAALVALAESTVRFFWTRHLDPQSTEVHLEQMDCQFLRPAQGPLKARVHVREAEREQFLFELRRERSSQAEIRVRIFNDSEQVVAEMRSVWRLVLAPLLNTGSSKN